MVIQAMLLHPGRETAWNARRGHTIACRPLRAKRSEGAAVQRQQASPVARALSVRTSQTPFPFSPISPLLCKAPDERMGHQLRHAPVR